MATLYYDISLPGPIRDPSNKKSNVDISTFMTPCSNKTSAWWSSLLPFTHGAKDIKSWLSTVVHSEGSSWSERSPYTMRVCPGIGDLFKRSYLIKWPSDVLLCVIEKDGNYSYYYKTSDGQYPPLVDFDFHGEQQYRDTEHQIYDNMFNIKLCLPVNLFAKKTVSVITVSPDYHLRTVPYKVMPGIINYTSTVVHELNINLMFPIPSEGHEYTLEFKAGDPICYLTALNSDRCPELKYKSSPQHYRKKFLRGSV